MCGRYSLTITKRAVIQRFSCRDAGAPEGARYNIAPTQTVPVVVRGEAPELAPRRWGLVPSWAKDPSIGARMINARAETVHEKPSFRRLVDRRRCLVPADGFYEWDRSASPRIPHRFTLAGGGLFALAGLWDEWRGPDGADLRTFTILTTRPNALLARVHDRMPVILPRELEDAWLDPARPFSELHERILTPYPADAMAGGRVSMAVNSPRNDTPACAQPATD